MFREGSSIGMFREGCSTTMFSNDISFKLEKMHSSTRQAAARSPLNEDSGRVAKRFCPRMNRTAINDVSCVPASAWCYPQNLNFLHAHFPQKIYALPHVMETIWTFMLSPQEAVMEASKANDLTWLKNLLDRFDCDVSDAVVCSASNGNVEVLELLLPHLFDTENDDASDGSWDTLKQAVCAAAENSHLHAVSLLLPKFGETDDVAWELITAAAKKGDLGLLKVATEIADDGYVREDRMERSRTLLWTIYAGQTEAATFLMKRYYREWFLEEALEVALARNLSTVADCIYDVVVADNGYGHSVEEFFVSLAHDGYLETLEFMYSRGVNNWKVVSNACVSAAQSNEVKILKVLLDTGKVSTQSFQMACWYASRNSKKKALIFLCASKLASEQAIKRAFESAGTLEISKLLYEKLQDPVEATKTAFRNATCCGVSYKYTLSQPADRIAIVKFLISTKHISVELVIEAFLFAATRRWEVVKALMREPCISLEIARKAYNKAMAAGQTNIAELLVRRLDVELKTGEICE
ncbi:unnamed protein product [Phytophthora fragariaefolia]|uniref:Unnamed protein product n=1 Tax=Phytophthora fragariaefolia TaxID=1490495 RepID=A0A9W7D0V8_9STRA|nr:unnamed protein product [Phytophthora fragariaefolia]